jgi:hypothetical protein
MFDELKPAEDNSGLGQISRMPKSQVDDIFAEVDKAPEQKSALPSRPPYNQSAPQATASPAADFNNNRPMQKKKKHGFRTFLIIIVILILVLVAAYFVYTKMMIITDEVPAPTNTVLEEKIVEPIQPVAPIIEEVVAPAVDETIATSTEETIPTDFILQDSDGDGLLDQEEAEIGTNPLNPDSDSDGLNDALEIKVYATDPLDSDSDHDTYLDGAEVQSGYNPNGAGKLQ